MVLYHHLGLRSQFQAQRQPINGFQVKGNATFVAAEILRIRAKPAAGGGSIWMTFAPQPAGRRAAVGPARRGEI